MLNDRIADKVEKLLENYTGYELIRTDDTTGAKDISLTARTNAAKGIRQKVAVGCAIASFGSGIRILGVDF